MRYPGRQVPLCSPTHGVGNGARRAVPVPSSSWTIIRQPGVALGQVVPSSETAMRIARQRRARAAAGQCIDCGVPVGIQGGEVCWRCEEKEA